jgi:hypothetical protein
MQRKSVDHKLLLIGFSFELQLPFELEVVENSESGAFLNVFYSHEIVKCQDVFFVNYSSLVVRIYDLDQYVSQIGGIDHEENHQKNGITLN